LRSERRYDWPRYGSSWLGRSVSFRSSRTGCRDCITTHVPSRTVTRFTHALITQPCPALPDRVFYLTRAHNL
jgi:hypothetical protein